MLRLRFLCIICLLFISSQMLAQVECQDEMDRAKRLYEEGVFRDAEKQVKKVLETCDLDDKKESEMLKLMASIYYEMDELELADEYIAEFRKINPNYVPNKKNDPYQFRLGIKKMKKWPRFSTGIRLGVPMGYVTTKKIYPMLDDADYTQDYIIKPLFLGNFEFAWNINNFLSVNLGAGVRIQKITHQVPQYEQLIFNYEELTYSAKAPLFVQLTIPLNSKFKPAFYVGGEFEYYLGGKYNYYYTASGSVSNDLSFYLNRKKDKVKIEPEQRNQYRYAALGGIRLMYNIKQLTIFADTRYVREFDIYNNTDNRFTDQDLFLNNNYELADIEFENLDIAVGILYNFSYKAKSKY